MHSLPLEMENERLWSQQLVAKIGSADGGGTKDEAGR